MGQRIEIIIDRFDGGISQDRRVKDPTKFALAKHFDTRSQPHKLIPYYMTEAAETKSLLITDFIYAPSVSSTFRLFGFGDNGAGKIAVYKYNVLSPGTSWVTPSVNASTLNKANGSIPVFFYYKDFIYMWSENKLVRFDNITESTAFNNAYQSISFVDVAQPVHHQADDIAYFFSDNKVHKQINNTTGWTSAILTLPDNLKIVSACQYGNYLAIACITKGASTSVADVQSVVFLWDRDSSVTTLADRIDFGRGAILFLTTLEGKLTAVMDYYTSVDLLNVGLNKGKIIVKQVLGGLAKTVSSLELSSSASIAKQVPFVRDDVLYFSISTLPLNSDTHRGIMSVDGSGRMALDIVVEEAPEVYNGIYAVGNQWWIAHGTDGSVDRIDDGRAYSSSSPSVYESLINGGDARLDPRRTKKLIGVTVNHEFLPANGRIDLYYRKDEDILAGSWTLIFTNTTDNSVSHGAINIESTGATLPEFKEIQFKIESLGGAVPTYLSFASEFIDKQVY